MQKAKKIGRLETNFFSIFAVMVYFEHKDGGQIHRSVNVMSKSDKENITRAKIAEVQQAAQVKFVHDVFDGKPPLGSITGVTILGISRLGSMTDLEFNEGFEALLKEQVEAVQALSQGKTQ